MRLNQSTLKFLGLSSLVLCLISTPSVQAQACRPLKLIGGEGTRVKKTVSPISTLITNNNWNTDFAVPGGVPFSRYIATIVPENKANYDLKLNLKYSDNTSTEFYNQNNVAAKVKRPINLTAETGTQTEPYQINVFVGGISAIGNTYTVSVLGCR